MRWLHGARAATPGRAYTPLPRLLPRQRSHHAQFVTEVCAGKSSDVPFGGPTAALYAHYGGPPVTSEMAWPSKGAAAHAGKWAFKLAE